MRIVVLLGGAGMRFSKVGYQKPKPFLLVDGESMLEHVLAMYPGDNEFILVYREDFATQKALFYACRERKVRFVSIPIHTEGPIRTLSYVWDTLPPDEPVLVTYCDFSVGWDFNDFASKVTNSDTDGAIPAYSGFHPHLLHKKKYAGIIADKAGVMLDIREKHSFTEDPEDSFHSAGNYYFSRAEDMRRYGGALLSSGEKVNGEQYVSMLYYQYLADRKRILVYPLPYFLQWGTPEDLEEYEAWSRLLQGAAKGVTDIPESRQGLVKIPYEKGSSEYKLSHTYWKQYFAL